MKKINPSFIEISDKLPHREYYDQTGELGTSLPNIEEVYPNVINNLFRAKSNEVQGRSSDKDRLTFELLFLDTEIPWLKNRIDEADIDLTSYARFGGEYHDIIEFLERRKAQVKKDLGKLNAKKVSGKSIQNRYELNLTHQILIIEYLQYIKRFIVPNSEQDKVTLTAYYDITAVLLNVSPEQVKKKTGKFKRICKQDIESFSEPELIKIRDDLNTIRPAFIGIEQILLEIDSRISSINQKIGK